MSLLLSRNLTKIPRFLGGRVGDSVIVYMLNKCKAMASVVALIYLKQYG